MPKGEGQEGKKRGPYKQEKDVPELREHHPSKDLPPRADVRKLLKPEGDPDLSSGGYQKKPKRIKEEEEKAEKIVRIYLNRKSRL